MENAGQKTRKMNNPFLALRHRNFQIYWGGMCISMIGTWMQNVAQPLLALKLTNSAFLLSLISAVQFTPVLLFSLFAGVVIDKFPKKRILLITQTTSLLITCVLGLLVLTGNVRFWHILVSSSLLGIVNTLDMPSRQSFVIELVGREDMMNAIALNSAVFNISRIVGPWVASLVITKIGYGLCFMSNSVSFAAVVIGLLFIKPLPIKSERKQSQRIFHEIYDGFKYIRRKRILLFTLLSLAAVTTFTSNFNTLLPVFTKNVLLLDEKWFGRLMSFMGTGSLLGGLFVASQSRSGPKKVVLRMVPFIIAGALIVIGFTNAFLFTGLALAVTGFGFSLFTSSANTTLQLNTANEYRGRVMSFYSLVFGGMVPIGSLFAGTITQYFGGARIGFFACGGMIILLIVPLFLILSRKEKAAEKSAEPNPEVIPQA